MIKLRKLIKHLALLALALTFATQGFATSAYPGVISYRQPDGQTVQIRLYGDERCHYGRTLDGYTLLKDSRGFLVYATKDSNGDMVPSAVAAADIDRRDAAARSFLGRTPRRLMFSGGQVRAMAPAVKSPAGAPPRKSAGRSAVGDRRVLVILVNFSDNEFTKTRQDFEQLMNATGYSQDGARGSVNDYFREASGGKLNLTADVVGPYKLSREMAYYGRNIAGYANDANAQDMAEEALSLADADVDFSRYDADGDGVIDGVHIIYAGFGEEAGGGGDCIWAHKSTVYGTYDGVSAGSYSCSPELRGNGGSGITRIGVICHELGHVLGCMDYYDTDYATNGEYGGTGQWDIMGSGNWNGGGATPAGFNPYVRCYDFGWQTPVELSEPGTVTIGNGEQTVYRLDTKSKGEFFLFENRQQQGFDAGLPGHGLMVYRVRVDGSGTVVGHAYNTINASHPQNMYPVSAGCLYDLPNSTPESYGDVNSSSCPFPGTVGKTLFSDETTPSSRSLDGLHTDRWIDHIAESDGTITFDFDGGSGNATGFAPTEVSPSSVTLGWSNNPAGQGVVLLGGRSPIDAVLEARDYVVGETVGADTVLYVGSGESFTHSGLPENTTFHYRLYTKLGSSPAEWSFGTRTTARTTDSSRPQYAFWEDFETMDWQQEIFQGEVSWTHGAGIVSPNGKYGTASWHVFGGGGNPSGFIMHSSMLISPQIDLSRSVSAALSFSYSMGNYQKLLVHCRTSPEAEWTLLETLSGRTGGWERVTLELPERSETVQLGFLAIHNTEFSSSLSREEAFIELDDVGVAAGYQALPVTEKPLAVSNTSARLQATVLGGTAEVEEYGVEIVSGDTCRRVAAIGSDTVAVAGLDMGAAYTYRTYAQTPGGVLYGDEMSFTTVNWANGDGTIENPFVVSSEDDLFNLAAEVERGIDFSGCHFLLEHDIKMTRPFVAIGSYYKIDFTPICQFNGVFDGNGKKIKALRLQASDGDGTVQKCVGLFGAIGRDGVVKHLTVELQAVEGSGSLGVVGLLACCNLGAVIGCHTEGKQIIAPYSKYITYVGGIVAYNFGQVVSCTNRVSLSGHAIEGGGIVGCNFGVVRNCVNYADIDVDGMCEVGGIVGSGSKMVDTPYGSDRHYNTAITECVNYGNISVDGDTDIFSAGGIAGEGATYISKCANYGDINTTGGHYMVYVGGIAGYMSNGNPDGPVISDCLNDGDISVSLEDDGTLLAGGICAKYSYLKLYDNCFTGSLTAGGSFVADPVAPQVDGDDMLVRNNHYLLGSAGLSSASGKPFAAGEASAVVDSLNAGRSGSPWRYDNGVAFQTSFGRVVYVGDPAYATASGMSVPVVSEGVGESCLEVYEVTDFGEFVPVLTVPLDDSREYTWCSIGGLAPGRVYKACVSSDGRRAGWADMATCPVGSGTERTPFEIGSLSNLRAVAQLINSQTLGDNYTFRQTRSIDLRTDSVNPWKPIGNSSAGFEGTYDGGGHSITNMYVDNDNFYAGFFGYVFGTVKNLSILGNNVVNSPDALYSGGVVGYAHGNIDQCLFHGKVSGGEYAGGVVGYLHGDATNCGAVAVVSGGEYAGGVVGYTSGYVKNCYAAIVAGTGNVGGITSYSFSPTRVTDSYYQETENVDGEFGEPLSEAEMKGTALVDKLNVYYGCWTADAAPYSNDGYPILKSSAAAAPAVCTGVARQEADGSVTLRGTCFAPGAVIGASGFEWRVSGHTDGSPYQEAASTSGSAIDIVANIPFDAGSTYHYRAFADINGTRVYGEELSFDVEFLTDVEAADAMGSRPYVVACADGRLKITGSGRIDNVVVSSLSGMLVGLSSDTGRTSFWSGSLARGLYVVRVTVGGRTFSEKVVVR